MNYGNESIKVSIIEDEPLVLQSLQGLLKKKEGLMLAKTATSVEAFLEDDLGISPDIILLDIGLRGHMSGLMGIRLLKQKYEGCEIIMLTTFDDSDRIFKALCAGAAAYLTKRTPFTSIAEAIKIVHNGGSYMSPNIARKVVDYFSPKKSSTVLTARQHQIVDGIVEGLSYKLIADKLLISTETVRDHIKKIYRRLEINSKTELINIKHRGELDT